MAIRYIIECDRCHRSIGGIAKTPEEARQKAIKHGLIAPAEIRDLCQTCVRSMKDTADAPHP